MAVQALFWAERARCQRGQLEGESVPASGDVRSVFDMTEASRSRKERV